VPDRGDLAESLDGVDRQKELDAYLDTLVQDLGWGPQAGEHLALELSVGLAGTGGVEADGHGLDDYLFPVVRRLGPVRFDAVFAVKRSAEQSHLRVEAAVAGELPAPPPRVRARITAPATSIDWKQQLNEACRKVTSEPAPAGPVSVQVRLSLSRRRNWTALWRPTLDSLGPILGVRDPATPYLADDARVIALGLHRRFDDALGDRVGVEIWWQAVSPHS
jgi:hypothetical protein